MAGLPLRHSVRSLLKSPGYSATAVLTLGLAIGASTAIFTMVDGLLLRPLPYPEAERLLFIQESEPQVPEMSVAYPNYEDYARRNRVFESMGVYNRGSYNLTGSGDAERLQAGQVSATLFDVMRTQALRGRVLEASDDRPGAARVTVISEGLWKRAFAGDPGIVGRVIRLNDNPVTVVGVMPDHFRMPTRVELWVPVAPLADNGSWKNRGNHPGLNIVARLKPGETKESARADMNRVSAELAKEFPNSNANVTTRINTLTDIYAGDARGPLTVLLGAVLFVLLIACANISNLTIARQAARAREFAVRQALGANLGELAKSTLTETALMAAAGGLAGVAVGAAALRGMLALLSGVMPAIRTYEIDARVLAASVLLTALSAIGVAALPLLQLLRGRPAQLLGSGARNVHGGGRLRKWLVASEVALTVVLLAGAGLFLRSFERVTRVDPGFETSGLLTFSISLPASRYEDRAVRDRFFEDMQSRLQAIPGVTDATYSSGLPLGFNGWQTGLFIEGRGDIAVQNDWVSVEFATVSPTYFQTLGVPVLAGRVFDGSLRATHLEGRDLSALSDDERSQARATEIVVDAEFAKAMWPKGDAVGKRVYWSQNEAIPPMTVVAVVGRVKADGLREETRRIQGYISSLQTHGRGAYVTLRSALDPRSHVADVRRAIAALDPALPIYDVRLMDERRADSIASDRMTLWLVGLYATMALLLALIGIFGVTAYAVAQQTREIGVRVALGASARDVIRLVVGEGLGFVGVGAAAGIALAVALSRVVQNQLFEVSATDPVAFGAALAILTAAATLATYVPARRAAGLDPVRALRIE